MSDLGELLDQLEELLKDPDVSAATKGFLKAGKARVEGRRCTCDLRDARWHPEHGLCGRCGALSWDRKWWGAS